MQDGELFRIGSDGVLDGEWEADETSVPSCVQVERSCGVK